MIRKAVPLTALFFLAGQGCLDHRRRRSLARLLRCPRQGLRATRCGAWTCPTGPLLSSALSCRLPAQLVTHEMDFKVDIWVHSVNRESTWKKGGVN